MSVSHGEKSSRIYVGNLPPDIREKDVEDLFYKFGKVLNVDLKNRRGPPFAFVEFDDYRDATDAVKARDGYDYDGYRLRVEFPRTAPPPKRQGSNSGRFGSSGSSNRNGESDSSNNRNGGGTGGNRGRNTASRRSQYRVLVTGLPASGSWQDLKDHMREAGDVCFADAFKDGSGVVEFLRHDDMKYAIKKLDDSKFRSHEGEVSYIRVKEASAILGKSSRSRSRSYSPRHRGSPTYSPVRRNYLSHDDDYY